MEMPQGAKAVWLCGLEVFLRRSLHEHSFKNDEFKHLITNTTPTNTALNILICSPLTTMQEKIALANAKKYYLIFTAPTPSTGNHAMATSALVGLAEMVGLDAALRAEGFEASKINKMSLVKLPKTGVLKTYSFPKTKFEDESFDFFEWAKKGVFLGVQDYGYKGSAFKASFKPSMTIVKALNVLLGSTHTNASDKAAIRIARDELSALIKKFPSPLKPHERDVDASCIAAFKELWKMFRKDAKSREVYRAPVFIQSPRDDDGAVLETYVINNDGGATVYAGGDLYVPPGAPADWVAAHRDEIEEMKRLAEKERAEGPEKVWKK